MQSVEETKKEKLKPDHDLAQKYYEKALREETSAMAPVYLMNLYSRW